MYKSTKSSILHLTNFHVLVSTRHILHRLLLPTDTNGAGVYAQEIWWPKDPDVFSRSNTSALHFYQDFGEYLFNMIE